MTKDNIGRNFLITKLMCAECGTALVMSNKPKVDKTSDCSDGVTGASKVEQIIWVEPCDKCVKAVSNDLETLKRILKG